MTDGVNPSLFSSFPGPISSEEGPEQRPLTREEHIREIRNLVLSPPPLKALQLPLNNRVQHNSNWIKSLVAFFKRMFCVSVGQENEDVLHFSVVRSAEDPLNPKHQGSSIPPNNASLEGGSAETRVQWEKRSLSEGRKEGLRDFILRLQASWFPEFLQLDELMRDEDPANIDLVLSHMIEGDHHSVMQNILNKRRWRGAFVRALKHKWAEETMQFQHEKQFTSWTDFLKKKLNGN